MTAVGSRPKVCLLVGSERSGSTLLARLLGRQQGFIDVGELKNLAFAWHDPLWRCGCGQLWRQCSFWADVIARTPQLAVLAEVDERGRSTLRQQTKLRRIFGLWRAARGTPAPASWASILESLYTEVAEVSGQRVMIDGSKAPGYGLLASQVADIDLYVLHLVREVRAVVFSWSRDRPSVSGAAREAMPPRSWVATSLRWTAENVVAALLVRRALRPHRYLRLDYEELVEHPEATVATITRFLGEAPSRTEPIPESPQSASHSMSGNVGRFDTGPIRLRRDDEWRSELPAVVGTVAYLIGVPARLVFRLSSRAS